MAYNEITDQELEPGQPFTSVKALRFRDNPIAIANGDAGAPRVQNAALAQHPWGAEDLRTGSNERNWVLGRVASAAVEAVGTYAMLYATSSAPNPINPGDNIAGSNLRYAGVLSREGSENGSTSGASGNAPSGTWKCMGFALTTTTSGGTMEYRTTIWLRIS